MQVATSLLGILVFLVIVVAAVAVVAVLLSKKSSNALSTEDGSYFDGGYLAYLGYSWLVGFVTIITFGIAFPWMCCLLERWKAKHTVICGKRQVFDGTGIQLIGKFLLWGFLTIITFGIYGFWMSLSIKKWVTKHTHFVGEEDNNSYFDGSILGLIGTNLLAGIVLVVPVVGLAWSTIIKLRWERSHTVIDSRRLVFTGTVGQFFVKYLLWGILTGITLGIYGLFVPLKALRLETENTIDHEHTNKALMAQIEYRNTVQNTVSANKNAVTEFEMEGLKAGINDTTDEVSLRALADNGLRAAQYLYAVRYAEGNYTAQPFSAMLKASAEAGYAPAMCLYALTHELDETYKNDLLSQAAAGGQIAAIRSQLYTLANAGLAEKKAAMAQALLEKAMLYADVLQGEGESLNEEEQELAKRCTMALRKIASAKGVPTKGGAGLVIGIIAGILAVLVLLGGLLVFVLGKRVESPAMRDDVIDGGYSDSLTDAAVAARPL